MINQSAKIGRVIAVHPDSETIDVILPYDGRQINGVPVMTPDGSAISGRRILPTPILGQGTDPRSKTIGSGEMFAIIHWLDGMAICGGFLRPHNSGLRFKQPNFQIDMHPSGAYSSIDAAGNFEFYTPSGAYIRIGTDAQHVDLSGTDANGKHKEIRATGNAAQVYARIAMPSGQTITMNPDGSVVIGMATTEWTGNVKIIGNLDVEGTITATDDVIANGVSLHDHTHPDPQGGDTSPPNA